MPGSWYSFSSFGLLVMYPDMNSTGFARSVGTCGHFCWKPPHYRSRLSIRRDMGRGGGEGHLLGCSGLQLNRRRFRHSGVLPDERALAVFSHARVYVFQDSFQVHAVDADVRVLLSFRYRCLFTSVQQLYRRVPFLNR